MNKKILLTLFHDFIILISSFFLALWIRLDLNYVLDFFNTLWVFSLFFAFSNILLLKYFGLYKGIWRYASLHEIISIIKSVLISALLTLAVLFLILRLESIPRSFPVLLFIISIFGVTGPRIFYRILKDRLKIDTINKIPILVVGKSDLVENFIRMSKIEKNSPYNVIGIIGKSKEGIGRTIHSVPILSSIANLDNLEIYLDKLSINSNNQMPHRIIIADNNLSQLEIESLFVFSRKHGLAIGEVPRISDLKMSSNQNFHTKPIVIEDVLGRKQKVQNPKYLENIADKKVLITGGGGSIGSELCKQVNSLKPNSLAIIEQNEHNLYKVLQNDFKNVSPFLADIRDSQKIEDIIKQFKPDIIFHAAALKHITFVEDDPLEALKTNFLATVKLCEISKLHQIEKVIFISTDKAVNPTNIMGATKRLCEKYIQRISEKSKTFFSIVRFGNVLGSTGSVVPLFQKQINDGGPITITHPEVTRYFMTIREAVELVLTSSQMLNDKNGEILILEMGKPVFIKDLAKRMIILSGKNISDINIKYTKLRKGEKINEELFFKEERPEKTTIDGILATNKKLFQGDISDYNNLISQIQNNKIEQAMLLLKKLLPEYKIHDKTNH